MINAVYTKKAGAQHYGRKTLHATHTCTHKTKT